MIEFLLPLHYMKKDLKYLDLKKLVDDGNSIKFGMLKSLYDDAVEYKKTREYRKGLAKFMLRIIPIAMAPIFFPVWVFSQIAGTTRALNKIIIPTLNMNHKNYDSFLKTLITKTMNLAEGDIRPFLGNDWYYDVFFIHGGLTKMIKQEYIFEFTLFICEEIKRKNDDQYVPKYWLDNEFRKWINNKFELDLPTGKNMIRYIN